jgi:acetyl-CoA carboxylase, biotin carboxylase subunit
MFQRILVANRGEIALRVIRACKEMGIEVVAVYSEADRGAPYLELADAAYCIGPAVSKESYLDVKRIIAAAELGDVQAIHPGYGFLSENPHFAEVCRSCKIEFIGPPEAAMLRLGNKTEARDVARKAGVPTVPGSPGPLEDDKEALKLARARTEAQAAFKDSTVYIEKYLEQPRHVEVQLLGDQHGNMLHLGERDCSLQRRHQKVVEETPAPGLRPEVRSAICEAAVRLAKEAGYTNAGTCEFLVDKNQNYYFIEVNARLQVEHPITEMVTGMDLVKWQIRIAAGESLPFRQEDIRNTGASIECRINAEDPAANFRPSPGRITVWRPPGGLGVRLDTHVCAGYVVPANYDSMVAKLIVYSPTRSEAIVCMRRALDEFHVEGIKTTIPLHRNIFRHTSFIEGQVDTTFIERRLL